MLTGEKIRLRAAEREDLPRFVAWLNDPEVRQGLSSISRSRLCLRRAGLRI
jgi:diamine N-acetyltransferase